MGRILILMILGSFLGAVSFVSPISMWFLIFTYCAVFFMLYKNDTDNDVNYIIKIFLFGLTLRMIICVLSYVISFENGGIGSLFQDDVNPPRDAWFLYQYWMGNFDLKYRQCVLYLTTGVPMTVKECYLIAVALVYSLVKYYTPIAAKLINVFVGSINIILVFFIGKKAFNSAVGRISAFITAVFPSLVIWSTISHRDTFCIFFILLSILGYLKFMEKPSIHFFAVPFISLYYLWSIRKNLAASIALSLAIAFIFNAGRRTRYFILCIVMLAGLVVFSGKIDNSTISGLKLTNIANTLLKRHATFVIGEGHNYKLLNDDMYKMAGMGEWRKQSTVEILTAMIKGIFYLLLTPFPWAAKSFMQIISIPQMVFWYFLLSFFVAGCVHVIRARILPAVPVLTVLAINVILMSLYEGNIGTVVRHRDVFTPLVIIVSSAGLLKILARSAGYIKAHKNHGGEKCG